MGITQVARAALDGYHSNDQEAIWVQMKEQKGPSIAIGTYYRPLKSDLESLECFGSIVNNVTHMT